MDGTPRNGTPLPYTPLTAPQARLIAEAFRPAKAWGSRRDYYYTRGKLGSDPLYDGVMQHLPDDGQPVLDLGCGLGLFAHVLRQRGGTQRYLGVDVDAGKIARAQRAAAELHDVRFDCVDVQAPLPAQAGHVLLLDVLQYLDAGPQQALLRAASARVAPGGCLLLRTPLATGDGRDRTTRVADRLAWLVGWMGTRPRHYPDPEVLQTTLAEAGLQATAPRPLHGRTPFNSWLLVAERPEV
ncbi:class I SAM-dependent methyltransferase [Stenotrophomonas maltophilia]|uniref:Class I SAM-dependent methyltransferase n=1 Tax=Stenotrophomonas maltophilia TaxID=40324 RepID=A0A6B8J8J3_STEMA|nr:class I SAM-dependent methyltransferase [Stenotrophomonas maltophilia]MBH1651894.1 class I SAM-dependent methyltransferase [Stenotrophomonas maltophilia]QGM02560.1 class I SAM-dependent methyltransferase [Stenotrophomonas maltophilia]HDS1512408.1 class I SAM-dependent methyltransferase [Stenotrophomonas maltophilia]